MKQYTIPIFVPHLGCPFDCIFCNQKRITGKSTDVTGKEVENIIEEYLAYFDKEVFIEVGFFGGSFTGIDKNIQRELLGVARKYKEEGKINEIRLSTRPDFIDDDSLELLKEYSVDTVELGVQSLSDEVLIKSGRGHTSSDVYGAVKKLETYGINVGLQMMVGLPGDSFSESLYTCKEFIRLNPYCVRIYPTLVIKDTPLEDLLSRSKYRPLELEEAINQVKIFLMMFELNDIDVIRVGLQPTDNIQLGRDVVSGPFHPAFKQLVESKIYKDILINKLEGMEGSLKNKELIIKSNNKNISAISGQKSSNKKFFISEYGLKKLKIVGDNNIKNKDFTIYFGDRKIKVNYKQAIEELIKEY